MTQVPSDNVADVWKVMIVGNPAAVHVMLQSALQQFKFQDQPLVFISAYSVREARQLLRLHPDLALMLLDLRMAINDDGLQVARYIRRQLKNQFIQIILRIDHPQAAPPASILITYDIHDYICQADLNQQRLVVTTIAALRSYQNAIALAASQGAVTKLQARLQRYSQESEPIIQPHLQELQPKLKPEQQTETALSHHSQAKPMVHEKQQGQELAAKNQALIQAKQDAEIANRAKSEFLANMSHELRTPLNAILGFSQLMTRDPSITPPQKETLDIINRSGAHLLGLINDVLDMSKIESGAATLNPNSFDLYALLNTLYAMLRLKAESKGLKLIFECSPDVPQYVKTDERKLRQVLINLIGNAIKFTAKGSVTLHVSRGTAAEKGAAKYSLSQAKPNKTQNSAPLSRSTLFFAVEDTGAGIAPAELATIFDAFVQTESGRQSQQGTGLGLPISQKFVQLMGGDITVVSQLGQGTTVGFQLQIDPVEASEVQTKLHRRVIGLAPDQPDYRILVVEDRPENRQLLVQLLESVGFTVQEAKNGQEAIARWQTWHPHLIWMDMQMPVMDGYEATKQIRDVEPLPATALHHASTKIIALTASVF
ncbi:MAG: response regulator, partial [Cyanothece sp. SIO1E1]|nr:response regulator [Cyanothece sp. SIO1E1]